jgi:hypothetical protein
MFHICREISTAEERYRKRKLASSPLHSLTKPPQTANKKHRMQAKKTLFLQPEWIVAYLITAAAIALHFYYWLHIGGLWRDEANLVHLSGTHSLGEMERDSFPLFMPFLLHAWLAAGLGSDLALRLLGLLVGLGILAALWVSTWKIRRSPPLLGLALFALNSSVVFWGDSIRAYGLGSLMGALLTASAFMFLQKPSGARAVWLVALAILSVQVLYHNAVLVAAICFGAWAVCWRRRDKRAALQVFAAAALSAASLLVYAKNFLFLASKSGSLRTGVKLPRFFASYGDTLGYPFSGYLYAWGLLYLIIVFCAGAGLWRSLRTPSKTGGQASDDLTLFAAVTLTLAVVGFPLFFWRTQLPMQSWYVLPFMASAVVCFDAALPVFRGLSRAAFFGFVAATALISVPTTGRLLNSHFSNVNLYAKQLASVAAPKDYIVVEPWVYGVTFDYYFKGPTPWQTLPPLSDHATHHFDMVQSQMQNTNAIAPVLQQIAGTLQSGHRVWILAPKGWIHPPGPGTKPPATLPPAPLPDTGWAEEPYGKVWAAQTVCFIADHSTQFGKLQALSPDRFITEDMDAFVASGWNTNSAP